MEEMPSLNMPVQRLKVTHSGEIIITGKSHRKKPERFYLNDGMDVVVNYYNYTTIIIIL
jgi:hypothetical protein